MPNEHDDPHRKFTALYVGQVTDNVDPKKLGRVRVNIPGVAEPTGWALPLGAPGGGAAKRGGWSPPPKGADVGVMFTQGDVDRPYYWCGWAGEGEAPDEVDEATPEEAANDVPFVFNGRRFKIVLDERKGKARCAIEDKKTGDMYEIDGVKLGLKLKSTAAMSIECMGALDIKASSVTINGRLLAPNNKPI